MVEILNGKYIFTTQRNGIKTVVSFDTKSDLVEYVLKMMSYQELVDFMSEWTPELLDKYKVEKGKQK